MRAAVGDQVRIRVDPHRGKTGVVVRADERRGYGVDVASSILWYGASEVEKVLNEEGAQELREEGGTATDVPRCSAAEMRRAGRSTVELRAKGYSAAQMCAGGYLAADMREAGYAASQLQEAGYSEKDLLQGGYTEAEVRMRPQERHASVYDMIPGSPWDRT